MPFCRRCGGPVQQNEKCPKCGLMGEEEQWLTSPGATEETLRFIFESIVDGMIVVDLEGNVIEVNEAMLQLGGFADKKELLGKSGFSFVDEAFIPILMDELNKVIKEGRAGPVEYVAQGGDMKAFTGEAIGSLVRDSSGNPKGAIVVIRDISERKHAEEKLMAAHAQLQDAHEQLKASQEQLIQSAKMAAVGQLVSGVAHEVNNPLMAIAGYAEMLLKKAEDESSQRRLQRLHGETTRAIAIVQNLLSFARKRELEKVPVSVNENLESVIQLRAYEMSLENIEIETDFAPDIPTAMGDFQQLQQVFLNLLINAEQAIKGASDSGKVVIRTRQADGRTRVTFVDDGPGIPEEAQSRIFEPFFTTKGDGEGTGLGLSICYGIIEDHGGKITVESKEGQGTAFTIELPVAPGSGGGLS